MLSTLVVPVKFYLARFCLKKSWLIIPLTALILAIGIMQTASVINIIGDKRALVEGAGSAIIPQGGQYGLQLPAHFESMGFSEFGIEPWKT